ncbi:tetratricopeptide repeat-containing sulfotransferase family protein [Colwellia sp. MEBiC06753]
MKLNPTDRQITANMNISDIIAQAEQAHRSGKLDTAATLYQKVLAQSPQVDALFGLATLYMQRQNYQQALSLFQQALSKEPNALDINFNYLVCLKSANQISEAKKHLASLAENLSNSIGNNIELVSSFANIAYAIGAFEQCLSIIKRSGLADDKLLFLSANSFIALQQWQPAITILQQLSSRYPEQYELLDKLAMSYAKTLNFSLAVPIFERAYQLNKSNDNLLRLADLYLLAQEPEKTAQAITLLSENGITNLATDELSLKLARLNNDKEKALVIANKLLQQSPNSALAWQVIGEFGESGDQNRLITQLQPLIESVEITSFEQRQNLYTLAKSLEKKEEYTSAFNALKKANDSQKQLFIETSNHYNHQLVEHEYQKLQQLPYQSIASEAGQPSHIFIVGMPRSGTTLTNRILSQLPNSQSANESNGIASIFETLLTNNPVNGIASYFANNSAKIKQTYRDYVGFSAEITLDKMPHNFRYVGAILSSFPNAKIVQMRRLPQDLALSIYSQQFNEYHNYACDLTDIAHAIAQANKLMDCWTEQFPSQVYNLNYEQLAQSPAEQAQLLFNFLELPWQEQYLNFYQQNVASFTFSEVQVRKPINKSKIGFSQHYQEELAIFREAYANFS